MSVNPESKPSLNELLERVYQAHAESTRGAMPATVVAYNFATQRVDVQPATQVYVEGELQALPIIQGVPVVFQGGTLGSLTTPLAPGDGVWLAPAEVDMSAWLVTGTPGSPPATKRRFSLSDCVAFPGLRTTAGPLPAGSLDATATVLRSSDVRLGGATAVNFVALANLVLAELQAIKLAYDSHTHAYAPGPGAPVPSGPPIPVLPVANPVACTTTKAL